jgi:hypothetical protein
VPTPRQLDFLSLELVQFMHFGLATFWDPPSSFVHGGNPTYHNCLGTGIDHSKATGSYYPCLHPDIFSPASLDVDNWLSATAAMGAKEVCITAAHEGGFALWPSAHTNYSVAASAWYRRRLAAGEQGDVLRAFADSANRHGTTSGIRSRNLLIPRVPADQEIMSSHLAAGIGICYYIQVHCDGYLLHQNVSAADYVARQLGKLTELLVA